MSHTGTTDDLISVEIVGLPIAVQVAAQQHQEELNRELMLVGEQMHQRGDSTGLPARFVELVNTLTQTYSGFTVEQEHQLADAVAAGAETIDLHYTVPRSAADAALALGQMLDEVDQYCRDGQLLLTLETPAPLVAYRWWFLNQFVDQAAGSPPQSWADYETRAGAPTE